MFTFIKESRAELRDTQEEIEKEQAVLKDTSDLLGTNISITVKFLHICIYFMYNF